MSIVYHKNKKTGITYAYESTSYWVPELKQPRNKRVYLGRVDKDGNIIPSSHKRGRKPQGDSAPSAQLVSSETDSNSSQCSDASVELIKMEQDAQNARILELEKEVQNLKRVIQNCIDLLSSVL